MSSSARSRDDLENPSQRKSASINGPISQGQTVPWW